MAAEYGVGDLVWAKMKGFPWWPSMIGEPRKEVKKPTGKNYFFVEFFGSNNYAWIQDTFIKKFDDNQEFLKCNKSSFKEALDALRNHKNRRTKSVKEGITPKTNGVTPKKKLSSITKKRKAPAEEKRNTAVGVDCFQKMLSLSSDDSSLQRPAKKRADSRASSSSLSNMSTPERFGDLMRSISDSVSGEYSNSYSCNSTHLSAVFDRPEVGDPTRESLLFGSRSVSLGNSRAISSNLRIGFLGLGTMGGCIARNLIEAKHPVTVWNRSPQNCETFRDAGASVAQTPGDVVNCSDVIFCCVSGPDAAKEIVFGNCGVLKQITKGKGYVEMTSIDAGTSKDIADAIITKGGQYIEAAIQGSAELAKDGRLILLAAGDNQLFDACQSCFEAISERIFFLGEIGNASKMNLVVVSMMAANLASLAEAMALAKRIELNQKDLLEILHLSPLSNTFLLQKAKKMIDEDFSIITPLMHMQKDLNLVMEMSNACVQPLPVTSRVNEVYKQAKRLGYSEHDISAVYRAHL